MDHEEASSDEHEEQAYASYDDFSDGEEAYFQSNTETMADDQTVEISGKIDSIKESYSSGVTAVADDISGLLATMRNCSEQLAGEAQQKVQELVEHEEAIMAQLHRARQARARLQKKR